MDTVEWAQVVATLVLGASGLLLAHSYRRQVKVKLAERVLDSYTALWAITSEALLHKSDFQESDLKTSEGRNAIGTKMHRWYIDEGNGLLLSAVSRELFFMCMLNLQKTDLSEGVMPPSLQHVLQEHRALNDKNDIMACRTIAQLSRLRSQLKADLGIYRGAAHFRDSRIYERDLLSLAGTRAGWPRRKLVSSETCLCGKCNGVYTRRDYVLDKVTWRRSKRLKRVTPRET